MIGVLLKGHDYKYEVAELIKLFTTDFEFLEEKMERRGRKGGRKKGNTSHNEFLSFARN